MHSELVLSMITAQKRDSLHWRQETITWGELTAWGDEPATEKACGNYVLGEFVKTTVTHKDGRSCTNLHRNNAGVVERSALTLDADHNAAGLPDRVEMLTPWAHWIHTTHSSSPDDPRYRLVIPTTRPMSPEEYFMVANAVLEQLGRGSFDPTTVEPARYMFKPAYQHRDWYESRVVDGELLDVDELLLEFDVHTLPTPKIHPNKRDPFTLDGVVGAFNRVYAFDEVIETFALPYSPISDGRWQLVGASSEAGMALVAPGLVYSHHANDPAWGQTASAFDLVRLHRFGDRDEGVSETTPINRRPSHLAMLDFAAADNKVMSELVGLDFDAITDGLAGPDDWKLKLTLNPRTGKFIDQISNWDLVVANDPAFTSLYFNEMTLAVEADADLPWRELGDAPAVTGTDRAALGLYVERQYGLRMPKGFIDDLVNVRAQERQRNPVREYLLGLQWDGTERVETCLPGVRPTAFTRMVARKSLVAAAARILTPGVKWDHSLVLFGPEGLGKSWWVERLANGYASSLGRIGDKDTLLVMQMSWIMLADEGHSIRKADADQQKEFLTRTKDVFRMPYDREAQPHPRHCVIWSSTNDQIFLRRQEGNRRFLIVQCEDKVDFDAMTQPYVDQLWAEAVHLLNNGERLFLDELESTTAAAERELYTEEDSLVGIVEHYLERKVPANWGEMSADARVLWLSNQGDGFLAEGTHTIDEVCTTQLWVEALGRRVGDHKRTDLLELSAAMKSLPGWVNVPKSQWHPPYGTQHIWRRDPSSLI